MPRSSVPVEVTAPVLMSEYLRNVALVPDPFRQTENFGSRVSNAGFVRATELSRAIVNCVSPIPRAEAVRTPMLFQVLTGASSTYWPITTCALPGEGRMTKRRRRERIVNVRREKGAREEVTEEVEAEAGEKNE